MRSGVFVVSAFVAMASSAAAQPNGGPASGLQPDTAQAGQPAERPPASASEQGEPSVSPPGLTQPVQPRAQPVQPPRAQPPQLSLSAPSIPAMAPAQPGGATLAQQRWRSDGVPIYGRQRGEVDEGLALTLPLLATSLSWVAMIGGVQSNNSSLGLAGALGTLMAPSIGHWYAGETSAAGLGMRLAGVATLFLVVASAVSEDDGGCDFDEPCSNDHDAKLEAALWAGVGLYVAGTIYDLATSASAAREHNHRLRGFALAPVVHGDSRGLALTGRF